MVRPLLPVSSSRAAWPGGEAPHRPFWAQRGLFCHHVRAGLVSPTRALNRAERGLREQGCKNRGKTLPHTAALISHVLIERERESKGCRQSLCLPKKMLCSRGSWWVLILQCNNIHPPNKACGLPSWMWMRAANARFRAVNAALFSARRTERSRVTFCQMEVSF